MDYITAGYRVPWDDNLAKKAEAIAVGMTVGSWTDLPDTKKPHLRRFLGEAGAIRHDGESGVFEIRYPVDNVKPSISSLLTVMFGKLSLDGQIRLESLDLPASYTRNFSGPALGIPGIRKKLAVRGRPLVMSIFKSENGRTLSEFREAFEEQIGGGVDLVKDDEIFMADEAAPLRDRILAAEEGLARREAHTGQKGFYIPVLSGTPKEVLVQAEEAAEAGAKGFLIAAYTLGLDILSDLQAVAPGALLVLHPAFSGGQVASPSYGIHPALYLGLLPRLAGADVVLYPSPYGSVAMPRDESLKVAQELRTPAVQAPALPGPSAGIHVGILPQLFRDFGSDVIINAGGAVHGHPEGTRAGAQALRDAADRYQDIIGEVTL
ncbi:RuBisCO large subunit C-terminal-like domain-containing protein [Sulfobacillus harzensis]|uniref:2,3-diketo-5-methylthiopentyl-1-phosphate enolase n=1 Tax=Sulfobacillus harzensis TaxID=2729629 RepID=A0A7Y0L3R5_9FIRM|nr:RuBisCO large subunit C-terminal-like domain-containing protein [Sulfobacillus harzensis]NMP21354.1 2,3-diketo-5-methylthiopentyl-1-phosphate enolase [Sulfobacillus harzensis]